MYVPFRQGQSARAMAILARPLGGDPLSLIPQVRGAVQKANSAIPLIDPMTLADPSREHAGFNVCSASSSPFSVQSDSSWL